MSMSMSTCACACACGPRQVEDWLGLPEGAVAASVLQVALGANYSLTVQVQPSANTTASTVETALRGVSVLLQVVVRLSRCRCGTARGVTVLYPLGPPPFLP